MSNTSVILESWIMDITEAIFYNILTFFFFIVSMYLMHASLEIFLSCSRTYYKKVRKATPFIKRVLFIHFLNLNTNRKILTPLFVILHWLAVISFCILFFINFCCVWNKSVFPTALDINRGFIIYNGILSVLLSGCYLRIWYTQRK